MRFIVKPIGLILILGPSIPAVRGQTAPMTPPRFDAEVDPPSPPLRFEQHSSISGGALLAFSRGMMVHRFFRDSSKHVFLGYDVLIEPQRQLDAYRVTIGELGMGPFDMFRGDRPEPFDPAEWKKLPLPGYPAPRSVFSGNTISIDLGTIPDTGQKLIDYVTIQPQKAPWTLNNGGPIRGPLSTVPAVEGIAREYSAEDAEIELVQPRVSVNGVSQDTTTARATESASGALVWFYLPKRGRYVLSLGPRSELGFVKAGEVRGGSITFTLEGDKFALDSSAPFTSGQVAYILYVLRDADWEPTAQAQRGHFQTGSVSAGEIALLHRK
jgi:hypothetical protein